MIHLEPDLHRLERWVRRWVLPIMAAALLADYLAGRYLPLP